MRRLLILAVGLSLIAAACGDPATEEASTTSAPGGPTTTAADDPTTTAAEGTTTTAGRTGGDSECLAGAWVLDNEAFVENFDDIFSDAGMLDAEVTALEGGTFMVELDADGSLSAIREGWGFRVETGEGAVILEIDGTETGSWSADGSILMVDTDTSDLEVSASIEADGQVIQMPSEFQPAFEVPRGIATGSDYRCDGDVLTLTNAGVESVMSRSTGDR